LFAVEVTVKGKVGISSFNSHYISRFAWYSYSSPATWNSVPTSIKNCSSLYSFKCYLKSHLI